MVSSMQWVQSRVGWDACRAQCSEHSRQRHPTGRHCRPKFKVPNRSRQRGVQEYLAHKKTHSPRTLPQAYAEGPMVFLGGWAFSYGHSTPVARGVLLAAGKGLLQGLLQSKDTHRP